MTVIAVELPKKISLRQLQQAIPILQDVLEDIGGDAHAMRGYLHAAAQDGFTIHPGPVLSMAELQELCIRAFWFAFEKSVKAQ